MLLSLKAYTLGKSHRSIKIYKFRNTFLKVVSLSRSPKVLGIFPLTGEDREN
jgi:hypothetical protein